MNDFVERTRPWETYSDLKPLRENEDVSKDPYASPEDLRSAHYLDYQWLTLRFTGSEDASKPHTRAFLTDSVPLCPDLLTGEVSVAFGLAKRRRLQNEYKSHRYIPATIFSASDRQLRIIQSWHDKQDPKVLHIRRSPILDFRDGSRGNWKDWIAALCWVAGKPVGDTKNGNET
ncbi:hypothetical protein N7492_001614 [Penicillium capsulatum]|uniref:Uncharacterized protein n=1 Tax=Penicillium capsulatum TaxID=69766 RepID=A0A9W9LZW2_9EURO|nr:hypothetical protein N7492_001614 [Penicillium capsulatum]KAJ6129333.1 hypothetical protein N7512_002113 [Penicillium capsulatum]